MQSRKRWLGFSWSGLAMIGVGLSACGGDPPADMQHGISGGGPAVNGPIAAGTGGGAGEPGVLPPGAAGAGEPAGQAGGAAPSGAGAGASAGTGAAGTAAPTTDDGVSYHKDIRPIIEGRCLGCHVDGGSGPFPLDSWEKIEPYKALVIAAVESRRMPPWLADSSDCTKIRHDQRLTEAQLALFKSWQAADYPVGSESQFVPLAEEAPRELGEPDMVIKASAPHRLTAGREYYACLQVDTRITADTWVTAMDIVPENDEYVHHAIVSVGNGTCSALGTTAENIYSYRPGSRTLVFEEGDALLLPAGSTIAIQYHYNTMFAPRDMTLGTDHSSFRLWTLPSGQEPERAIVRMPHHDLLISIPVNAVNQKEGGTASIGSEYTRPGAEIIGISPHMHYLGQSFTETLRKADGSTVCLVDIPDWDQDWQLDYFYDPADYIPVGRGDRVTQECVYSNRAEDQGTDPEGNPFTPQRTSFGEDTRQEMCLGYIWFRYPLNGAR
jgi:hypothetical protein